MKPFGNLAYPSMVGSLKAKSIISDADEGGWVRYGEKLVQEKITALARIFTQE